MTPCVRKLYDLKHGRGGLYNTLLCYNIDVTCNLYEIQIEQLFFSQEMRSYDKFDLHCSDGSVEHKNIDSCRYINYQQYVNTPIGRNICV